MSFWREYSRQWPLWAPFILVIALVIVVYFTFGSTSARVVSYLGTVMGLAFAFAIGPRRR